MADNLAGLEFIAGIENVREVTSLTRKHLSSGPGARLSTRFSEHLWAFNAIGDLVPYFGDARLAYSEASYQLKNSVSLAFHGFYSQAFSTLRSVCELSLLQSCLPEGELMTDRLHEFLASMTPADCALPEKDEVNWVLPAGFGATQTPRREATTLLEWAVDGCRTPRLQEMKRRLLQTATAVQLDAAGDPTFTARLDEVLAGLSPYVHARGRLRCASELSSGSVIGFSTESLSQFGTQMMFATQVSLDVLLVAFLADRSLHPEAAAGFLDYGDFLRVEQVLPAADAAFFREIYLSQRD